jgi:hypothetical protein
VARASATVRRFFRVDRRHVGRVLLASLHPQGTELHPYIISTEYRRHTREAVLRGFSWNDLHEKASAATKGWIGASPGSGFTVLFPDIFLTLDQQHTHLFLFPPKDGL